MSSVAPAVHQTSAHWIGRLTLAAILGMTTQLSLAGCGPATQEPSGSRLELSVSAVICVDAGGCQNVAVPGAIVKLTQDGASREERTSADGTVMFDLDRAGMVEVTAKSASWKIPAVTRELSVGLGTLSDEIILADLTGAVTRTK